MIYRVIAQHWQGKQVFKIDDLRDLSEHDAHPLVLCGMVEKIRWRAKKKPHSKIDRAAIKPEHPLRSPE